MTRVYWWFDGVDENRPGGPWWYRDFTAEDEYYNPLRPHIFANALAPFCKSIMLLKGELPYHGSFIQPPASAIPWPNDENSAIATNFIPKSES